MKDLPLVLQLSSYHQSSAKRTAYDEHNFLTRYDEDDGKKDHGNNMAIHIKDMLGVYRSE